MKIKEYWADFFFFQNLSLKLVWEKYYSVYLDLKNLGTWA